MLLLSVNVLVRLVPVEDDELEVAEETVAAADVPPT